MILEHFQARRVSAQIVECFCWYRSIYRSSVRSRLRSIRRKRLRAKVKRNERACVLFGPTNNDGLGFRVVSAIIRLHRLTSPSLRSHRYPASFLAVFCLALSRRLPSHASFRLLSFRLASTRLALPCLAVSSLLATSRQAFAYLFVLCYAHRSLFSSPTHRTFVPVVRTRFLRIVNLAGIFAIEFFRRTNAFK